MSSRSRTARLGARKLLADGFTAEDNGNWTYSIGANWQVTDFLRFRARYGTSFRAPALFDALINDIDTELRVLH